MCVCVILQSCYLEGFNSGSDGKESACNAGATGLILGSGRSPGGGNDYHSSVLAWEIPWTEEPGGLQFGDAKSPTQLNS